LRARERVDLTPGHQWRDLLYIDDAVDGLLRAGETALQGLYDGAYNLCSGQPVTIRAVAEAVAREIHASEGQLGFGVRDYRPEEQMWMVGDPTRFLEVSGFRPRISLDEGIRRTVAALDAQAGVPNETSPVWG